MLQKIPNTSVSTFISFSSPLVFYFLQYFSHSKTPSFFSYKWPPPPSFNSLFPSSPAPLLGFLPVSSFCSSSDLRFFPSCYYFLWVLTVSSCQLSSIFLWSFSLCFWISSVFRGEVLPKNFSGHPFSKGRFCQNFHLCPSIFLGRFCQNFLWNRLIYKGRFCLNFRWSSIFPLLTYPA